MYKYYIITILLDYLLFLVLIITILSYHILYISVLKIYNFTIQFFTKYTKKQ